MGGVRAGMGNVDGWDCLVALCEVVELHGGVAISFRFAPDGDFEYLLHCCC